MVKLGDRDMHGRVKYSKLDAEVDAFNMFKKCILIEDVQIVADNIINATLKMSEARIEELKEILDIANSFQRQKIVRDKCEQRNI